jgi:hypothetical protein
MKQFVAKSPDTEVMGILVLAYIAALGQEIEPIAESFGLSNIDPQAWYKEQTLLDLLKEAAQGDMNATFDMVKIGMRMTEMVTEQIKIPPTIEQWFLSLPESVDQTVRGKDAGELRVRLIQPKHIEIYVNNPYPCDMCYGIYYAAARLTRPDNMKFSVVHRAGSCRKHGGEYCIYDVKWGE